MERYLREVGAELASQGVKADIVIVGGAFMTLVLRTRDATKDVGCLHGRLDGSGGA